ncbi:hypothetical protein OC842_000095 [Tilletia horrida]|uniref:Uncharacterized protein n=1 Tax=Tilletia horrida TaxID=155126 RepID=A0AAN6JN25_9BASI|nr:hypothetical protein OC842_000095 [Tilletia horrida]
MAGRTQNPNVKQAPAPETAAKRRRLMSMLKLPLAPNTNAQNQAEDIDADKSDETGDEDEDKQEDDADEEENNDAEEDGEEDDDEDDDADDEVDDEQYFSEDDHAPVKKERGRAKAPPAAHKLKQPPPQPQKGKETRKGKQSEPQLEKGKQTQKGKRGGMSADAASEWLPVDFGVKVWAAGNPKAKVEKDKKPRQLGAQRLLKLTHHTTFNLFKTLISEIVAGGPTDETISGDWSNWAVEVQLNSSGSLYSDKTELKSEVTYNSFVEELLASKKRSATVQVFERERLTDSQKNQATEGKDPNLIAVEDLKYASTPIKQYDRQLLKRWLCNDKECKHKSPLFPSCFVNPKNPRQHVNLKCGLRYLWAAAIANGEEGITVSTPPATEEFFPPVPKSDADEDDKQAAAATASASSSAEAVAASPSKPRRKPLQPAKKRMKKAKKNTGLSAEDSIDVDQYSSSDKDSGDGRKRKAPAKTSVKKEKVEESPAASKATATGLPRDGPEMTLAQWVEDCSVPAKLADILREAGYERADELVMLEGDESFQKELGIERVVAHQFQAAMKRWRQKTPATSKNGPAPSVEKALRLVESNAAQDGHAVRGRAPSPSAGPSGTAQPEGLP